MSRLFDKAFFNQFLLFLFIIAGAITVFMAAAYYRSKTGDSADEQVALKIVQPVGTVVVPVLGQ